jgi:hypothetical protein
MSDLPAPLIPAEVDLRDFPFMQVDIARLFGSEFHAQATDAEWRAGITLWLKSFHQTPAASIPNDDVAIARLAELGRDVRAWKKIRAGALRGWIECSDGRLYHKVVAAKVIEAWIGKLVQRKRSVSGNNKQHGSPADIEAIDRQIASYLTRLKDIEPGSKLLQKKSLKDSLKDSHKEPHKDAESLPVGSQGTGTGTGTVEIQEQEHSVANAVPPNPAATPAGALCARLRSEAGLIQVNPSDPRLLAALAAGVQPDLIVEIAKANPTKPQQYAVAKALGLRTDAASQAAGATHGKPPASRQRESRSDAIRRANGLPPAAEDRGGSSGSEPGRTYDNDPEPEAA